MDIHRKITRDKEQKSMKKKHIILFGISAFLLVLIGAFLLFFPYYLESDALESDYVSVQSKDGKWKAYLIPDPLGMLSGYIIYQGECESLREVTVTTIYDGELWYKAEEEIELNEIDTEFSTRAQKYILSGKSYYQIFEYGNGTADVDIKVSWRENGETYESEISIQYHKWNPHDLYESVKSFWGIPHYILDRL